MNNLCAFSSVSSCSELENEDQNSFYTTVEQLSAVKVNKIFSQLSNDSYYDNFTEQWLIESRSGVSLPVGSKICAKHRLVYDVQWRPHKRCYHPDHYDHQPAKKKKINGLRNTLMHQFKAIHLAYPSFPLFAPICTKHRTSLTLTKIEDSSDSSTVECEEADPPFAPDRTSDFEKLNSILDILSIPRIRFPIHDLTLFATDNFLKYQREKFQTVIGKLENHFASIAPGHETTMKALLFGNENESIKQGELFAYKNIYSAESNDKRRIEMLSKIDAERFTKQQLVDNVGCSYNQIRKAREMVSGSANPETKNQPRDEDFLMKTKHFISYLYDSGSFGDLAYGTVNVQLSSGERMVIPKPILTGLRTHVIANYLQFCTDTNEKGLSKSSLLKILNSLKPSQRHCLSGLDSTMVMGIEGFGLLQSLSKTIFENTDDIITSLINMQRYFKSTFSNNCNQNSTVPSHCTVFSLSDNQNPSFAQNCNHVHSNSCINCNKMFEIFEAISSKIGSLEDQVQVDELEYDFNIAKQNILKWQQHIVKHAQQNKAKLDAFSEIEKSPAKAVWLRDWGQKILPQKYREDQSSYFGKKGMSIHLDVFMSLNPETGNIEKQVFVSLFDNCKQSAPETMSFVSEMLKNYKLISPHVTSFYLRMDNAGCYAANGVAEGMYKLCEINGYTLLRIDHNEPQKGKDQCDREAAVNKAYIKAYINAGNNCTSALQLKSGIMYQGGPPRTHVGVFKINHAELSGITKRDGIQSIHSIQFNKPSMTFWKYYNIGEGEEKSMNPIKLNMDLSVISQYEKTSRKDEHKKEQEQNKETQQISVKQPKRLYAMQDEVYKLSADMLVDNQAFSSAGTGVIEEKINPNEANMLYYTKGWCISNRKVKRFDPKIKQYMLELFTLGELTGKKFTAAEAFKAMRSKRDPSSGEKEFPAKTYISIEQIKSLFARFTMMYKKNKLNLAEIQDDSIQIVEHSDESDVDNADQTKQDFVNSLLENVEH